MQYRSDCGIRISIAALLMTLLFLCDSQVWVPAAAAQEETAEDAARLNQQALELYQQGKAAEAIPLAERALEIRKRVLGENHPDYAKSLINLAELYMSVSYYEQAEP